MAFATQGAAQLTLTNGISFPQRTRNHLGTEDWTENRKRVMQQLPPNLSTEMGRLGRLNDVNATQEIVYRS